jgi:hypothetical protein
MCLLHQVVMEQLYTKLVHQWADSIKYEPTILPLVPDQVCREGQVT